MEVKRQDKRRTIYRNGGRSLRLYATIFVVKESRLSVALDKFEEFADGFIFRNMAQQGSLALVD